MKGVSKKVIKHLNEVYSSKTESDSKFIQFIRNLSKITPEEIEETKQDILRAVKRIRNNELHEDVTDDARDYILSRKSKIGKDITFEEVLDTFDDLFENPNKNFREIMMGWYAYCSGEIGKLYHFKKWQMITGTTIDNVPFIDFLVPENISNILISDLRSRGLVERNKYETLVSFVKREFRKLIPDAESIANQFDGWVYLRFAPMSQKNVRNIIRRNSKYIYHITDVSNINSIIKNGIQIDNRSHPEVQPRIFLLVPNRNDIINKKDVQQKYPLSIFDFNDCLYRALPLRLHQYRLTDGSITEKNPYQWEFAIIKIDIDKIPDNVEFYWDIHSFPFAFFTQDNIPSSSISECIRTKIKR